MGMIINPYAFGSTQMSLTYVGSRVASAASITLPVGSATGDIAILYEYALGDADVVPGTPSGWTAIDSVLSGTNFMARMYYRVLQSGDTGVNTGTTATEINTALIVYRPSKAISAVTKSTWNKQITSNNPGSQTVAASGGVSPLVVCGLAGTNGGSFNFSTASPAFDVDNANDSGIGYFRAAAKLYNAAASDHTIDMSDEGSGNALMSGYLAVA